MGAFEFIWPAYLVLGLVSKLAIVQAGEFDFLWRAYSITAVVFFWSAMFSQWLYEGKVEICRIVLYSIFWPAVVSVVMYSVFTESWRD